MSIGANIAESCGKSGNSELHRFLQIASSSASELEYLVLLAEDLSYLTDESHRRNRKGLLEARKMLTALLQKVSSDHSL